MVKIFNKCIFIIIFLIYIINCDDILEDDPKIKQYKCVNIDDKIEIGDKVALCIHIKELDKRMAYILEVDKYSIISMTGVHLLATTGISEERFTEISFIGQISNKLTKIATTYYRIPENNTEIPPELFQVLNLVIKVDEGTIKDIVWDNQCFSCDDANCVKDIETPHLFGNDTIKYSNCKINEEKTDNVYTYDPKFYITWFGSDKHKRQLKSSNLAMSKFKRYSITSLFDSVKNSFTVSNEKIPVDDVKKKIDELIKQ